jgi:hypothetical protein
MLITYFIAFLVWLGNHLISVFGVIISITSVWIARQQTRIAGTQLRHEQYDRKRQVHGMTKAFLISIQRDGRVTGEAYQRFVEGTADAEFLFSSEILKYLEGLRQRAIRDMQINERFRDPSTPEQQRTALIDEEAKLRNWFAEQFTPMRDLFRKAMRL